MFEITEFGRSIKIRLMDTGMEQKELVARVREKTGKYFDSWYLWKIINGDIKTPTMVNAICEILDIENTA